MKIEIIDSLMGNGKTFATLRYIEQLCLDDKSEKWLYCTERLDEIDSRIKENQTSLHLWNVPVEFSDRTKSECLLDILCRPDTQLVAITHEMLVTMQKDEQFKEVIGRKKFKLYLDETIDLIRSYDDIKYGDFMLAIKDERISVDEDNFGLCTWVDESSKNFIVGSKSSSSFNQFIKDSDKKQVFARISTGSISSSVSLVSIMSDSIFKQFSRVILTTYNIKNTLFNAYCHIRGIELVPCESVSLKSNKTKDDVKSLITMVDKYNQKMKKAKLSSTWYEERSRTKEDFKLISSTIANMGNLTGCKGKPEIFGYTLPKSALGSSRDLKKVYPHGYPHEKCIVPQKDFEKSSDYSYIPCNARATNEYSEKVVMCHAYNRYIQPSVRQYLSFYSVPYDDDVFALNELIQWVWRSAIRKGESIKLAILSDRMRSLWGDWISMEAA